MRVKLAVRTTPAILVRLVPVWICLAALGCDPVGANDGPLTNGGTGGVTAPGSGGEGVGGDGLGGQGVGGQGAGGGTASCDPAPPAPCSTGWVLNSSRICGLGGNGGITCGPTQGDGLCYKECTADADCADPCFPQCKWHNLFRSSDAGEIVYFCEP